jgi:hypothetical protein
MCAVQFGRTEAKVDALTDLDEGLRSAGRNRKLGTVSIPHPGCLGHGVTDLPSFEAIFQARSQPSGAGRDNSRYCRSSAPQTRPGRDLRTGLAKLKRC